MASLVPEVWLLALTRAERSDRADVLLLRSLPTTVSLQQLAQLALAHITLSMLAQVWLADQRAGGGRKKQA